MTRLNVLFIPGWYPSARRPMAGVFIKEHAKAASIYDNVVVLYSEGMEPDTDGLYEIADSIEDNVRTLRVRYRQSCIPKTTYFIYLWSMFAAVRRLLQGGWRPDVIHAHVYSAGVVAVLLGRCHRVPVVISEHSSGFPRGLVRGLEKVKAQFAFRQAVQVCPVSEYLREHIEASGVQACFRVIPNTVDTCLFSHRGDETSAAQSGKMKQILLVAQLTPVKGVQCLFEALANLRGVRNDFTLDIVGDGMKRTEYENLAEELGLTDLVRFHGAKPKFEVAEFMRRCDFAVLPSLVETFGVVLIEAMSCGKPVIATASGGPKEIVTEEAGCLVRPGDSEALAGAINCMLDRYVTYKPEYISRYAQRRYGYEAVGKRLHELYMSTRG